MRSITISSRFCGPPTSGNGGITAGLVAREFPTDAAVEVTLHAPPPLETVLDLRAAADKVELVGPDGVVASAVALDTFDIAARERVDFETAQAIVADSVVLRGEDAHPFPTCFVCGPARAAGDGLRLFPAQVPGTDVFAAPWVPLDGETGTEFVWAVLDCPSSFPMYLDTDPLDGAYVLGRITARVQRLPEVGQQYVVMSWRVAVEGRKLITEVVLYDAQTKATVAQARSIWIRIGDVDASKVR